MTIPVSDKRAVTPGDIVFADPDASPRAAGRCPACGDGAPARPVLRVPSLAPPHAGLELYRCPACDTLRFDPPGVRDFADVDQVGDDSLRHYVDVGGGVVETIGPLLAGREHGSLLDVGCGFGFTVDFWLRGRRGEAIGIESAAYGRAGARAFGVPILAERLDRCPALAGRRFDVVYASEVIEHVADPRGFVRTLAAFVAPDGVLVLTTPAASYVRPDRAGPGLLAALAPGFHGFLLSTRAFEEGVRASGFAHVEVRVDGVRQVLRASRVPLAPAGSAERFRDDVARYLRERADDPGTDADLGLAYRYRLLRDLVRDGRWDAARTEDDALAAGIAARHGRAALDPEATVPRYAAARALRDAGAVGPYFLPGYYHLAAAVARHARGDPIRARALHRGAVAATRACTRIGPLLFIEAIDMMWPSRVEAALLGIALGVPSDAADLAAIVHESTPAADNGWTPVDVALVERMLPAVAEDAAFRRMPAAARTLAEAYRAHAERRYGGAFAAVESIEAALAAPDAALPPEPLFLPWFAALESHLAQPGDERAVAEVVRLLRLADRHAGHARAGASLRAFAARARDRTGLDRPSRVLFEATYRIGGRGG